MLTATTCGKCVSGYTLDMNGYCYANPSTLLFANIEMKSLYDDFLGSLASK